MANKGKIFEAEFKNSAQLQDIFIIRLNDVYMSYKNAGMEQWTPKNPYDFLIYNYPNLFAIECKSTTYKRISIQRDPEEPDAMIHAHQIQSLINISQQTGAYGGFLLNWRNDKNVHDNYTYYISIENFSRFLVEKNMKSISLSDCIDYGGIKVEGKLKRVHYLYDIATMLEEIRKETYGGEN